MYDGTKANWTLYQALLPCLTRYQRQLHSNWAVVQSWPGHILVLSWLLLVLSRAAVLYPDAKFPHRSVVTCSMQISSCRGRTLRTRPRTIVCKPLMPDVVVPKVHHNNSSYVSSADLPLGSLCKNSAWWALTRRTSKKKTTTKIAKIAWWALARDNMVIPEKGRCGMTAIFSNCYVNSSCALHIFTSLLHMYCISHVVWLGCSCQILSVELWCDCYSFWILWSWWQP